MRRVSFRSKYVLVGMELKPLEDGIIDVGEDGIIMGVGKIPGSNNVVDLGNTVLMPMLVNAHVHVLDQFLLGLYGKYYIDDLVGAPYGLKYQVLKKVNENSLMAGLKTVFRRIKRYGVGCILSIIEYGSKFARIVVDEAKKEGLCIVPFAEPSAFRVYVHENEEGDVDEKFEEEVKSFMNDGFNISLISPLNYTMAELRLASSIVSRANHWVMTHVSETEDTYADNDLPRALSTLNTERTIMVHLTQLNDNDLSKLPPLPMVVCPRSNVELVGRIPRINTMIRRNHRVMVGTDNVALIEPNPWDEIRTLRALLRYNGNMISDEDLLRMVVTWPKHWGFGFNIIEGEPMKAIMVGLGYDSVNINNIIYYLVNRVSLSDVLGIINETSLTRFN